MELIQKRHFRCLAAALALSIASGCDVSSLVKMPGAGSSTKGLPASAKITPLSVQAGGSFSGRFDPSSKVAQSFAVTDSTSDLAGMELVFSPGSLAVPTIISLNPSNSLVSSALASEFGADATTEIESVSSAITLSSSEKIDALNPFSLAIPVASSALRLAADSSKFIIVYRIYVAETGKYKVGYYSQKDISVETTAGGFLVKFFTSNFGSFQVATSSELAAKDSASAETTIPVTSKAVEKFVEAVKWESLSLVYDSDLRTFAVTSKTTGPELLKCVLVYSPTKARPYSYAQKSTGKSFDSSIPKAISGTLYWRMECLTDGGTTTLSDWNGPIEVKVVAASTPTPTPTATEIPWVGTKQFGASEASTYGQGIATDSSGNVFVCGDTNGGVDGNTVIGQRDLFITKYDRSGSKQWTSQVGKASQNSYGLAVATDSSGNVFAAGSTDGGLDGSTFATGYADALLMKYDNSGTRQWTKQLGVANKLTFARSVATDSSGNVFIGGYTNGSLPENTSTGTNDFFVAKFTSSGTRNWIRQLGVNTKTTYGMAIATDSSGNIFVGGATDGGLDGNSLTGSADYFLTKYDDSGTKQWTKQKGVTSKNAQGYGIDTDSSGNVFLSGTTAGGLNGLTMNGVLDAFVTKFDASGTEQWTRLQGVASKHTESRGVSSDASGNIFVGGFTNGGLAGNGLNGLADFFVTKYDSSGAILWTQQLGVSSRFTYGFAVSTDLFGSVFATGLTDGGLDGNVIQGYDDTFVTKFSSFGVKQ